MSNSKVNLINKEATEIKPQKASKEPISTDVDVDVDENVCESKSSDTPTPGVDTQPTVEVDPLTLEFNRKNIEVLGNHIHLVDSDEESKIDMFCYVKCNEEDNDLIKQCRGVVFSGNDIVMKAFPYTSEFNHTQVNEISMALGDFKKWTFYESHEGACVRMFHHSGKWFTSTHRKLNAFRSKWASRESFGTLFKNALLAEEENNPDFKASLPDGDNILERFQSNLDTSKHYMFLIRNTEDNRIVCSAPDRPTVYHVGTFVNGLPVMTEDVKIPFPKKLTILNIDELQKYVAGIGYSDLQGVIGFTSNNNQIKIVNKDYQDLFRARGNEPSIKFRYLQVRMNRRLVNMLYHLYPNMVETFDEYENTLFDIARSIYRAYVQRFIKKRYVTVPREEFAIIRECHSWHLSDRTNNRISLDQVVNVMNQQSPTQLNHMTRRFKLDQIRQKDQSFMTRPRTDSIHSNKSFEQSPVVRNINPNAVIHVQPLLIGTNNEKKNPRSRSMIISSRKPLYVPSTNED